MSSKKNTPEMPSDKDPIWINIVSGNIKIDLTFLAAKILLTRIKLRISQKKNDQKEIYEGAKELRNLYLIRGYLPDARKDLEIIMKLKTIGNRME